MRDAGHDVTGVTLKLWGGESDSGCCSVADVEDARRVAAQLGIPHYVFNFADDFDARVVGPYVDAYADGRTPNPCVECNRSIKFGRLLERADALGFDAVATGHHARVRRRPDGHRELLRGADAAKDQSYVLYMLGQARARPHAAAGRGADEGRGARARGAASGCAPRRSPRAWTSASSPAAGGAVPRRARRRPAGRRRRHRRRGASAQHDGVAAFTIGQRRGVGVAAGERRYVVDVDARHGHRHDRPPRRPAPRRSRRFATCVRARAAGRRRCAARCRSARTATPCPGSLDGDRIVRFARPQPRVAPGQVVALYDGDVLLGGGIAT